MQNYCFASSPYAIKIRKPLVPAVDGLSSLTSEGCNTREVQSQETLKLLVL